MAYISRVYTAQVSVRRNGRKSQNHKLKRPMDEEFRSFELHSDMSYVANPCI